MHQLKKRISTQLRERLADPLFTFFSIGFVFFFLAYVTGFKFSELPNLFNKTAPAQKVVQTMSEQEYLVFFEQNKNIIRDDLGMLDQLLTKKNSNTKQWNKRMKEVTGDIEKRCLEAIAANPPVKYKEAHQIYLYAVKQYREAMRSLEFDEDSPIFASNILDAEKYRKSAEEYRKQAEETINKIK